MTHRSSVVLAALVLVTVPACSALVSPDTTRLGGEDAGQVMDATQPGNDAWFAGRDAWVDPTVDAWTPPMTDTGAPCPPTQLLCGGACVSPSTDNANCGRCGNACTGGATCVSGVCSGGTTGSPFGNPNSCGPSGQVCGDLEICLSGTCICRPPYTNVGGQCIDLNSDPANCGTPGNDCGGDVCQGGRCVRFCSGSAGLTECNGACVDLRRDPGNCGDCGVLCAGDEVCIAGNCHRVSAPRGCSMCPCTDCGGGSTCCQFTGAGAGFPLCISDISFCPG